MFPAGKKYIKRDESLNGEPSQSSSLRSTDDINQFWYFLYNKTVK